ncbi:ribonuclease H-like domain-containing protein [Tanacetum coccineum]
MTLALPPIRETFPSFENVRTMLLLKESSFNNDSGSSTDFSSSSSSPTVLLASNQSNNKVHSYKSWNGVETEVPPKTAQAILARQRERKAKSIMLLAISDEYQLGFHTIKDAKSLWAAIKSRFSGNVESKKMQKNVLKQQFENFSVSDTEGLDKAYDRRGHFARECRAPTNQGNMNGDARYRIRDNNRRIVPVETYDALVVHDNALIDLIPEGLESVEAQLIVHQKNEVVYEEKIAVLEFEVKDKDKIGLGYGDQMNESDSEVLNSIFDSRSSDDDYNQTNDRFKKGNGYHAVPPPLTGNYMPPLADLSFAGLDDSVYRPTPNKASASISNGEASVTQTSNINVEMPKINYVRSSEVLIEDWVSDDEDIFQSEDSQTIIKPSFKKIEFTKARNEPVKSDKLTVKPRMVTQTPKRMPKESVLGKGTGHREVRPVWNNNQSINHQNKFVSSVVLTRSGRIPVSTAKQHVNTATYKNRVNVSKSKINTFPKSHSPIRKPFYKSTVLNTRIPKGKVNTVRINGVNTAGKTAISTVKGNGVTAVKASTSCVWRPKMTDLNNVSKDNSGSWVSKRGNPQQALKNKGIFDSGCSRHMTGNKDFLTDYQDIDGGFVAFGGGTRGGKITGKGKIRTDKLDFEDVFFVKELNFNLFSVSQMCDKKNNVLFTETECLVLSPDFKLLDENQVLLRVPRQSNMYSFDLRNVVPYGDLTCLFANAIIDESKLWHRRMGHVNFKTMNKLVKGNLVRGLPSKIFVNDHTCVACQKGK